MEFKFKVIFTAFFSLVLQNTFAESTELEVVRAGGIGGNLKTGMFYYDDGLEPNHKNAFFALRDPVKKICYLRYQDITVRDYKTKAVIQFPCEQPDPAHNNVYWNDTLDYVNGAYHSANDVFFAAQVTKRFFTKLFPSKSLWVNEKNEPALLNFYIHAPRTGFYGSKVGINGLYVSISDGDENRYPLSSLDVVASLIGEGYKNTQSWIAGGTSSIVGTEIAFLDLFGKAAEYAADKKIMATFGEEIVKEKGKALRYFDKPSRDCEGNKQPGETCSIDEIGQNNVLLRTDGRYLAGIMNKPLYQLAKATEATWDMEKVFTILIHADQKYWGNISLHDFGFRIAACGLKLAAEDYRYDTIKLTAVFRDVGIDISACKRPD